ncbi:ribonuclease H-like domain, reverse transcriptase, RNA-dependent DNA polymerase [Tanacetum coccineum]
MLQMISSPSYGSIRGVLIAFASPIYSTLSFIVLIDTLERTNVIPDLEPTLLMAIIEVEEQEVSLHEENVGYKETNMDSLWNGTRIKSYRLFDPTTQRVCVSGDVKFKENETWDWKDYISEHTDDEPKWTDFRIGNLEVTNKHHDHETQPLEEDNEFPNNNDDDYASPRNSPLHPQTPHTPSTHSSEVNSQVTPNTSTQSYYQSDNESIQIMDSPSHFDHTPVRDDLIITGTPKKEIDKFKAQMEEKFEMSDLGLLAYYLGIEVTQTNGDISIKQSAYASKILKEAGMIDCNETLIPMDPGTRLTKITEGTMVNSTEYRSLIGCLRYLLHTRPDLSYSVGLLSRFMQEPREQHMKAIRQVLRYVKGTKDHGITYKHNGGNKIHGYSDSSYGCQQSRRKGINGNNILLWRITNQLEYTKTSHCSIIIM